MELLSRRDATAKGWPRYFTGVPCKRGHVSERQVGDRKCIECRDRDPNKKSKDDAYYRKNADAIKALANARYHARPNKKEFNKKQRAQRLENIRKYDRMRDKRDRENRKAVRLRWIAKNPEPHRQRKAASNARYRARHSGIAGVFTRSDIAKILKGQKRRCWWCNGKLSLCYHMDHRIPISRGGTNDPGNIVASCAPCNRSKGAKMPWEFAGTLL